MTKAEALKVATEHIGKSEVIYVASDNNVFFAPQRNYAEHHAKSNGVELFVFTPNDLQVSEEKKPKKSKD